MHRGFQLLLLVNAIFNAVGAVILMLFPAQMMGIFGISLCPSQYFICYLLGVCSFGFAVLSFYARKIRDNQSLCLVVLTFFLFHLATAAVGIYTYLQGFSPRIWTNVGVHSVFAILFWLTGFRKNKKADDK